LYSTYLGGSSNDIGLGIAADSAGNAYVTGYTKSTAFPTTSGAFDTVRNDTWTYDGFVTELAPAGSTLVYSTFLGGNSTDMSKGIVIDTSGNAYVTGTTISTDFPFTVSGSASFVTKLNAAGSALIFSNSPGGAGIARDGSGNIYTVGGSTDVALTKRDPLGTVLYTHTFGGSGNDSGLAVAVAGPGNVFVTGETASTDFPTTTGAFQTAFGSGPTDAFVAKLSEMDTIQFSAPTYSVTENGLEATITITRIGTQSGDITVTYDTSNGSATAPADYADVTGTRTWFGTDTTPKTFTVPISEDALIESNETINLSLSNLTGGAALGSQSTAVLTITDNDSPGTLQFSAPTYSVHENGVNATITVTRSGGSAGTVSVDYATTSGGTATAGVDYSTNSGTRTFTNGDTTPKTFDVSISEDSLIEGNETVNLALSNPTGGATLGTPNTAVLTIVDNDAPLLLSQGQPATAQSAYSGYPASNAVDGNTTTSWNAGGFAPRWIYVDLGSVRSIAEVRVLAGVGSPTGTTNYNIDVSNDATNWTTLTSASNASNTVYTVSGPLSASARYVRINVTSHSGGSWIGLREFQVYGF
jgi:hypothetical protein